ncbi:MAG: hypothetical protein M4579_001420 [Chaenotheca gracillima]|nr:MAG: hypothetical protein M4579_001420 [Chaenotheca gracillima]
MASIFTFDPEPPRVLSPWLTPSTSTPRGNSSSKDLPVPVGGTDAAAERPVPSTMSHKIDPGITRLDPEPQEGPTEYKLHLLLRPRRSFCASSTGFHISGSQHFNSDSALSLVPESIPKSPCSTPSRAPASSTQSRQARLQQLTTQLLWRLQQSSPYHSSGKRDTPSQNLADRSDTNAGEVRRTSAIRGVEESLGALYEIGVADDGKLLGITGDEMAESLTTLKGMAATLGCEMEVLRMLVVGDCAWHEPASSEPGADLKRRTDQLWVAEALVKPILVSNHQSTSRQHGSQVGLDLDCGENDHPQIGASSATAQLRVSLAGATTSGKSSLLGTLSTATLDNGRGKSRLSLLKHRHELATGLTSTVAPELIGYTSNLSEEHYRSSVVNYASEGVASWGDMHALTKSGRLVFFADSAGHPRYRRTAVRGLVGWAPHWTLLCVAADCEDSMTDNVQNSSGTEDSSTSADSEHTLSMAHLRLCLSLKLPLVVVITKLDLATRNSLRSTLSNILTTLKNAGRQPIVVSSGQAQLAEDSDFQTISREKDQDVDSALVAIEAGGLDHVAPIVLTSVVKGAGITTLHALLRRLPVPVQTSPALDLEASTGSSVNPLFHIEEVFTVPMSSAPSVGTDPNSQSFVGTVVSGHLRYGEIPLGSDFFVGPFPADEIEEISYALNNGSLSTSTPPKLSTPPHLRGFTLQPGDIRSGSSEWCRVKVVSIRNLRQPVRTLLAGQVGTIGIIRLPLTNEERMKERLEKVSHHGQATPYQKIAGIRKGMILGQFPETGTPPRSQQGIVGRFAADDVATLSLGGLVVVYISSVRASAHVTRMIPEPSRQSNQSHNVEEDTFSFALEEQSTSDEVNVTLEYTTGREWVEIGAQVLIMPGGGPGLFGGSRGKGSGALKALVGDVVDVLD